MVIYLYLVSSVFLFAFLLLFPKIPAFRSLYLRIHFVQLLLVAALRCNVGKDYLNYRGTFHLVNRLSSFDQIYQLHEVTEMEMGYLVLNRIAGLITDNYQIIFLISSFITLTLVFNTIRRYSKKVWFSMYLFIVGGFVSSLNIQRQYIAVAILFYGLRFLKERNFKRYLMSIGIASLFHTSALLMIPLYFISGIRLNLKNMMLLLFAGIGIMLGFERILGLIQLVFYTGYRYNSFFARRGNLNTLIFASINFALPMMFRRQLIQRDPDNRIYINLSYVHLLLAILSQRLWIITRLMPYTSIFFVLLMPEIVNVVRDYYLKLSITGVLMLMNFITFFNTLRDPSNLLVPYQIFF